MVKDKNGTEIKIGDTVRFVGRKSLYVERYENAKRPVEDFIFTVDGFVTPFGGGNRIWITGPELESVGYVSGSELALSMVGNAVSPLAVVKVDTFVRKAMPTFSLV